MGWKYVMFENTIGESKVLFPVIVPDKMVHADLLALRRFMPGWQHGGAKAVSAGTIEHISVIGLGGDSETLGLSAAIADEAIIDNYSYCHGIL